MNIDSLIEQIINNFDWAYMLTSNVMTYLIIKTIDYFNGDKEVKEIIKKGILVGCVIILGVVYKLIGDIDNKVLLNSAILAPVAWDYVFKYIIRKFKMDYKHEND